MDGDQRIGRPSGAIGLLAVALGLAGLALAAAGAGALRDEPGSCAGPERGGVGYTRAAGAGDHVVAVTVRPDPADGEPAAAVQFAGPNGPVAASDVRLTSAGAASGAARTTETGCYSARLPGGARGRLTIAARVGGEPVAARIDLAADPRADAALLRRIRRATAAAARVTERITVRQFDGSPAARVSAVYSGDGYRSRTAGRPAPVEIVQADWRNLFYWMAANEPRMVRRVGAGRRGGRELAVVTAWLPGGLWSELIVDSATGAVHEQRMLAAHHNMRSRYTGFGDGRGSSALAARDR